MRIYADYAATAPLKPEARSAMLDAMDVLGNPSSIHQEGRAARYLIEQARENFAKYFAVSPQQVIFTSSGTESCNLGLNWLQYCTGDNPEMQYSDYEHDAVYRYCGMVQKKPPTEKKSGGAILAQMLVNNETGQQFEIRRSDPNQLLFCDAVQAFGKFTFTFDDIDADALAISSHKIGGSMGAGALIVKPGAAPTALIHGGGQERGWRAGTENPVAIAGFSAALSALSLPRYRDQFESLSEAQIRFEYALRENGAIIAAADKKRVKMITNAMIPGHHSQTLLMQLDLSGIAASSGAACSSGKVAESRVLKATGYRQNETRSAIRFSFGWRNNPQELDQILKIWRDITR